MKVKALYPLYLLLLSLVVLLSPALQAQVDARTVVTFVLPEDFGNDLGVGYEGFSQCSDSPNAWARMWCL